MPAIKLFRIRILKLLFFPLLFIGFLIPFTLDNNVFAEIPLNEYPTINLGSILVSAQRTEKEAGDVAENVYVITKEDIAGLPVRDINDVLKYIPGVDIQVGNQFGQATSVSIHGSDSKHVLVMLDGIPFNTQLSGQANPTRLPLENIERIEVIKGSSSSAWGSSLGGVINIITKPVGTTARPKGNFKTSYAEFSTTRNSLELSGKVKELGYYIAGSFAKSDGIKSKSESEEKESFVKLAHSIGDEGTVTGFFGNKSGDVNDGINPNNKWYSTPYLSRFGQLKIEEKNETSVLSATYKYNDQDITSDRYHGTTNALESSTVSHNFYQGLSLNSAFDVFDDDLFVAGADFDWHTMKSNQYLEASKDIGMQAPYANYSLKLDKAEFIGGIRYDHNQTFGSQVSPSLGFVYNFNFKNLSQFHSKVSRAFNAPPLLWIYNEYGTIKPNPDLKAERALVYEAGFEGNVIEKLKYNLDFYRSDAKDAIAWVVDGGFYIAKNFKKFRRQGVELGLDWELTKELNVFGSTGFNDVENRETRKTVRDQSIARQSYKMGMNYKNKKGFGLAVIGNYNRSSSEPSLLANDRKFIFDAKLSKEFKGIKKDLDCELFLNVYNLTNSKYWSNISYPTPERYFEGGISLDF